MDDILSQVILNIELEAYLDELKTIGIAPLYEHINFSDLEDKVMWTIFLSHN